MDNSKKMTVGGVIVMVAALVVLGGLLFWAFGEDIRDEGEVGESIISFELGDEAFLATSVGMDKIEVRYLPAGENPSEVLLGEMTLENNGDEFQQWSRSLPSEPLLVQSVSAHGYIDGVEVDAIDLGADDLAELRVMWFEVPTQEVSIGVGESVVVDGLTVTLVDILEDSRCPANANCIQAGQVRAQVKLETVGSSQIAVLSTNTEGIGFDNYFIEIIEVLPQALSDTTILRADYEITFAISRDIKL